VSHSPEHWNIASGLACGDMEGQEQNLSQALDHESK